MSDDCLLQPQVLGEIGSPNNVLTLSEHDCDVFSALNTDDVTRPLPLAAEKPAKCPTPPPSMSLFLHVVTFTEKLV